MVNVLLILLHNVKLCMCDLGNSSLGQGLSMKSSEEASFVQRIVIKNDIPAGTYRDLTESRTTRLSIHKGEAAMENQGNLSTNERLHQL